MTRFDEFMGILKASESREEIKEFGCCAIKTLTGDPDALAQLSKMLLGAPAFYKNAAFKVKLESFLRGTCSDEEHYKALAETISEGNQKANAERILECLDALETETKVVYVINATRSYIRQHRGLRGITKELYFRILYIIKNILIEDIEFLIKNLELNEVTDSDSCVALSNLGLMYITTSSSKKVKYAFNSLAYIFYDEIIKAESEDFPVIKKPEKFPTKMDMGMEVVEF